MNPDVKQKWIAALRSGDYKQTREQLRRENSYCCLGVLTDLYDKDETVEREDHWCGDLYSYTCGEPKSKYKSESVLPQPVMEWAGLEEYNPTVKYSHCTKYPELNIVSLAFLNDHENLNFEQIADIIEEQY